MPPHPPPPPPLLLLRKQTSPAHAAKSPRQPEDDESTGSPAPVPTKHQIVPKWRFQNTLTGARQDGLLLKRWVNCLEDLSSNHQEPAETVVAWAESSLSPLADVIQYTDAEYTACLADAPGWSKPATDYLFQLCRTFDLRFPVVADQWDFPDKSVPSTMEDLKDRYMSVNRRLLRRRFPNPDPSQRAKIDSFAFDMQLERARKRQIEVLMARTPHEVQEEHNLAKQLSYFANNSREMCLKRDEILSRFYKGHNPHLLAAHNARRSEQREENCIAYEERVVEGVFVTTEPITCPAYLRSSRITVLKGNMQHKMIQSLSEFGIVPPERPQMLTYNVLRIYEELKNEIIQLMELRRHGDRLDAEYRLVKARYDAMQSGRPEGTRTRRH